MIPVREPPPPPQPPGGRAPLAANSAALEDSHVVRSYARQSQTVPRDPQVPWSALLRVLGPQRDWLLGPREPPAPGGVWGGAECRATGLQRTPAQEPASAVERWLLGRARRVPHASGPGRPELDTQSFPLSTSRVLRGRVIQILLKSSGPHYDSHRVCSDECARVV